MATSSSSVATVTTACLMAAVGTGGNCTVDRTYLLSSLILLHCLTTEMSYLLHSVILQIVGFIL